MTLEQLSAILLETKFPVAFQAFPKKDAPPMPYLCYEAPQANNFYADGIVYHSSTHVSVLLYTDCRDLKAENAVEQIFAAHQIPWTKDAVYDEREKCFEILYEIEV